MAFSTHDIVPDSPTNNFAVCNKGAASNDVILSNGNLTFSRGGSSSGWRLAPVSIVLTEGKYYCEFAVTGSSIGANHSGVGTIDPDDISNYGGFSAGTVRFLDDGGIRDSTGTLYQGSAFSSGTVIGLMFDIDANGSTCDYYRDGTFKYQVTGLLPKILITGLPWHNSNLPDYHFNFGQDSSFGGAKTSGSANATDANGIGDFYHSVPSDAKSLCTSNLPDPAIDPATDDLPEDFFKCVRYAGDQTNGVSNNIGFKPDLIWVKGRNVAYNHVLIDSLRPHTDTNSFYRLHPDTTAQEADYGDNLYITNNGFDCYARQSGVNETGYNFIAWCWKASGSGASSGNANLIDTNGISSTPTISSIVSDALGGSSNAGEDTANHMYTPSAMSINRQSGFSILTYQGHGTNTYRRIPHGLNKKPDFAIFKQLTDSGYSWRVYHKSIGATHSLQLETSNAAAGYSYYWNNTEPTDKYFTVNNAGALQQDGKNFVAYIWTEISGFSAFNSYVGNGSASGGPYIATGFKPALVWIKCTSDTTTTHTSWAIYDNAREPNNVMNKPLYANQSAAEGERGNGTTDATDIKIDFLSNGFRILTDKEELNDDDETYIFCCWAEMPSKYSNAR